MDPQGAGVEELATERLEDGTDGELSFRCDLCDKETVRKIAQAFLPGLATACIDNTRGDIFRSPGSVAADLRREMTDYLTQRSENFVAEHIVLDGGLEAEASHHPYDIVCDFIDDFATLKRNWFSRVSGWLLSERREDDIDDFAQEMETNGFWQMDPRERIAQTLLKNVDYKNSYHCSMKFNSMDELREHVEQCSYRSVHCENEGCNAIFCAGKAEKHDSVCSFKIIQCEQNCSDSVMRRDMDRHCITVCPMKLVNCPFYTFGCPATMPQCKTEEHCSNELRAHLTCVLRNIHKEDSLDDLKPRVEQLEKSSTRLAQARDARSLAYLVRDLDAKLGPVEIQAKNKVNEQVTVVLNPATESAQEHEAKAIEARKATGQKINEEGTGKINTAALRNVVETKESNASPEEGIAIESKGGGTATESRGSDGSGMNRKEVTETESNDASGKGVDDCETVIESKNSDGSDIAGMNHKEGIATKFTDASSKRVGDDKKAIKGKDSSPATEEALACNKGIESNGSGMPNEAGMNHEEAVETSGMNMSH